MKWDNVRFRILFFNYVDQPVVKITLKPTKMFENKEYWFECIAESRPPITELV